MTTVSVVLPCLNEEESIGQAIKKIQAVCARHAISAEIIVVDNASTDTTAQIAKRHPITYVFEPNRGYGNAYQAGFQRATGTYIIMGDPDSSYDFNDIPRFLAELQSFDVVLGSRFLGSIEPGAMPFLHRYVGNPGIRFLFYMLFGLRLTEPSTGFLGIHRKYLPLLQLSEPGMEFSSEMLVRIHQSGLRLTEIPIDYHVRSGSSKLRTFRDGFRHLCFLLKERYTGNNAHRHLS